MFKNYLTVAVRNLLRHKVYSAINIAGLAIGMACCIVILLMARYELSFDNFHEKADRIYRITGEFNLSGQGSERFAATSMPVGPAVIDNYPEAINYTRFMPDQRFLAQYQTRQMYIDRVFFTDPSLFEIFNFKLVSGSPKTALVEPNSLVLTEETAKRLFGDESPLGKVIKRDGEKDYQVTGVLQNLPCNSHIQFDMLISTSSLKDWGGGHWYNNVLYTYLLLDKGADRKAVERKFPELVQKNMTELADKIVFHLQPLQDIHLKSAGLTYDWNWNKSDINYVYMLLTLAFLIILIASFNFMNLSTVRSANRAKEVGMRKVAGAQRIQLINQFLGESVLLSFCALFIAVALIELALPTLNNFFGNILVLNYLDSWVLPVGLIGIALCVGIFSGSYPAFFISAFKPITVLKGVIKLGSNGLWFRKMFIVVQFSISIILIICTILISKQLHYMKDRKLGFNKDQVVIIPMEYGYVRREFKTIRHELMQNPAITGVTASSNEIGDALNLWVCFFEGCNPDDRWTVSQMVVDSDFPSFYGLQLADGRDFSSDIETDLKGNSYIVNEALVKKLGLESPIGKKFGFQLSNMGTIIGVVKDFHFKSLHHLIEPLVLHVDPGNFQKMSVRVRSENITATLKDLERKWAKYVPGCSFEYSFLDEDFARLYQAEVRMGKIVGAFSLLAIFIACLGLLGLISFSAESRTKEIGIRKVLGASVTEIILLLSREYIVLLGLAILIAWPVAWYLINLWLENFAYRIEIGWMTFLLGGVIALAIAALTVSYQAIKAATANPVESLRYE